jgi:hypothetical protein
VQCRFVNFSAKTKQKFARFNFLRIAQLHFMGTEQPRGLYSEILKSILPRIDQKGTRAKGTHHSRFITPETTPTLIPTSSATGPFATSRTHSTKRSTTGFKVRFFSVKIKRGHGQTGKSTGSTFSLLQPARSQTAEATHLLCTPDVDAQQPVSP